MSLTAKARQIRKDRITNMDDMYFASDMVNAWFSNELIDQGEKDQLMEIIDEKKVMKNELIST